MKSTYTNIKPKVCPVDVDGVKLYAKSLTFGEYTASQKLLKQLGDDCGIVVSVLFCACDADGKRVFCDDDVAEVEALPIHVLSALNKAAVGLMEFNADPKA